MLACMDNLVKSLCRHATARVDPGGSLGQRLTTGLYGTEGEPSGALTATSKAKVWKP